ncbi:common pilus major fimbrillin subunit EcpA [Kosakonia sp. BK9b]
MKHNVTALILFSALGIQAAQAADITAQAVASWQATAKKDTSGKLAVTPLGSLSFQYAAGLNAFNSQKGLFDVSIDGDTTATAFKLTSRLVANTLTQLDGSGSTLDVGVNYQGTPLAKGTDTTLIDTAGGIMGGNLSALSNGYKTSGKSSAQENFTFSIISGTTNGTAPMSDFSQLPEGVWSGDVSVQFDAT